MSAYTGDTQKLGTLVRMTYHTSIGMKPAIATVEFNLDIGESLADKWRGITRNQNVTINSKILVPQHSIIGMEVID